MLYWIKCCRFVILLVVWMRKIGNSCTVMAVTEEFVWLQAIRVWNRLIRVWGTTQGAIRVWYAALSQRRLFYLVIRVWQGGDTRMHYEDGVL